MERTVKSAKKIVKIKYPKCFLQRDGVFFFVNSDRQPNHDPTVGAGYTKGAAWKSAAAVILEQCSHEDHA